MELSNGFTLVANVLALAAPPAVVAVARRAPEAAAPARVAAGPRPFPRRT